MDHLNSLSAYGAHPKEFDPEQLKPVLNNLDIIIKWYLRYREADSTIRQKPANKATHDINQLKAFKRHPSKSYLKLRGIIAGLFILAAIIIAVIFFSGVLRSACNDKETEKSIAVLPFKLLSDESDKQYLAADLDTTFALAWGELSRAHVRLIYLRQDLSESRYRMASEVAGNALRLGYDQARVHIALGYYYLYAFRDENQALKHLEHLLSIPS